MKKHLTFGIIFLTIGFNHLNAQNNVLRLDFNGNAEDISGNNNDGIVNGATLAPDRFGNINSAYLFDGIDDYIFIPYSDDFNMGTGNFAISLWINTSNKGDAGMIFQKGSRAEFRAPQYWLRANDRFFAKELVFLLHDSISDSNHAITDTSNITDGIWHHIVAQRSDSTVELYCDSKLVSKEITTIIDVNDSTGISIGAQNPDPNRPYMHFFFDGYIDDIKLFRSSLSSSDINNLFVEEKCTGYFLDTIKVINTITEYDTIYTIVYDTVHTTVNDTIHTIVEDVLSITVNLSGNQSAQSTVIKVYPNPTKDKLHILINEYELIENYTIKIVDLNSKIIFDSKISQSEFILNLSEFGVKGMYLLHILDENSNPVSTKKILLE